MKTKLLLYFFRFFKFTIILIISLILIRSFIIEPGRVNGISMEPNFVDGDVFLVEKISYLFKTPQSGDVVQIINKYTGERMIKRVVAVPGEQIKISKNYIYLVEGERETKLVEMYLATNESTKTASGDTVLFPVLNENNYFVIGDNRNDSHDSRNYGSIHRSYIMGKVLSFN